MARKYDREPGDRASRALLHPHLVKENLARRVKLVVPNPFRDEVRPEVIDRYDQRKIDHASVERGPLGEGGGAVCGHESGRMIESFVKGRIAIVDRHVSTIFRAPE